MANGPERRQSCDVPIPIDIMGIIVQKEMEEQMATMGPDRSRRDFLYNFLSLLTSYNADAPLYSRRYMYLSSPRRDIPHGERKSDDGEIYYDPTFYSQRYLADTSQSFINSVDLAMAMEGVDEETVKQMVNLVNNAGWQASVATDKLVDYMLPVYVRLRSMGYAHTEIVQ